MNRETSVPTPPLHAGRCLSGPAVAAVLVVAGALLLQSSSAAARPPGRGARRPAEPPWALVRVQMTDANRGWAVGLCREVVTILRTTTGGRSWVNVSPDGFPPRTGPAVWPDNVVLSFLTADTGWCAAVPGENRSRKVAIEHTTDGGAHWDAVSFAPARGVYLGGETFLQFTDQTHGFLLGSSDPAMQWTYKTLYRTADGGRTWFQIGISEPRKPGTQGTNDVLLGDFIVRGMVFRDPRHGWITGSPAGTPLLRTSDGGDSWRPQAVPVPLERRHWLLFCYTPRFFGPAKMDGTMLAQFSPDGASGGMGYYFDLYTTHDGGDHWRGSKCVPIVDPGEDIPCAFRDPRTALVMQTASPLRFFLTTDGGESWKTIAPRGLTRRGYGGSNPEFLSARTVLLPALSDDETSVLSLSDDLGSRWKEIYAAPRL